MKEFLKFFGIPVPDSAEVTDVMITFHGISPGWAIAMALAIAGATIGVYLWTSPQLSSFQKWLLAILRSVLLIMILVVLMRPVLLLTVEGTIQRSLLVLIDSSASMQIKDLRQDDADLKRAGIATGALDPRQGLSQPLPGTSSSFNQLARSDVLKQMLTNDKLNLLAKLGESYNIVPYTFGQTLQPLSGGSSPGKSSAAAGAAVTSPVVSSFLDSITFDKPYTAIGDAVRSLLDLKRGQPVAGILLITDGNNNYGSEPMDAAALAQQDKVPIFAYGVGITSPHDIIVEQIFAPDVAFVKEEVPVSVLVRSQSMSGRTGKLVLKLGDQIMDSKDVSFGADGEQTIPLKFTPPQKGDYELEASIDPLPDEADKDNNKTSRRVSVIDSKVEVLYVEQKPRWEFRFLQAMMIRDPRLDVKFYLAEGDPEIGQEQNSPYLSKLPSNREDWMKYDVIMIGDVDPKLIDSSQIQEISDMVSDSGAGVVFLAGNKFMPDAYRGSKLENLLPVEFEGLSTRGESSRPIMLNLTPAGQNSDMMKLVDDESRNVATWKELPGVYWDARVTKAKPAAEVLLDDPSPEKSSRNTFMPVVSIQSYGAGQALFMGTDESWRWRRNVGEKYFTRFWGQVILRLGLPRVMGASKLTQLVTDKKTYVAGDRVIISGKIYHSGFQPLVDSSVTGSVTIKPDQPGASADLQKSVTLQAAPGKPGFYEGEMVVTTPGIYSFTVANDPKAVLDFRVTEPRFEFGETALNVPLLQKMAEVSGGAFYREEDLYKMLESPPVSAAAIDPKASANKVPEGLGGHAEKIPSPEEVELAFSPYYYAVMILIGTIEWILRKRWRLK